VADSIGVVHSVALVHCTVATNIGIGGLGGLGTDGARGPSGTGSGGVYNVRWTTLSISNTVVGLNVPDDVVGTYSGDHNLIGTDPRLQPLAYNGGLTPTLALQTNSPAIDAAIPIPGVDKDQRGVPRPYGSAPDIGERVGWSTTAFVLTGVTVSNGSCASASPVRRKTFVCEFQLTWRIGLT
jgi:hypothetical protein